MPLLREQHGAVAILTLSRPEARNAWWEEFQIGLRQHLPELEADPAIHCVILTGDEAGGAFSAGADLKNPRTHTMESVAAFIQDLPNRRRSHPLPMLTDFAKPIIAAVNGYAVGIGCIVSYCCDLIVASERAEWRLPQSGLGIIPAQGGATRLARWVGKGLAMRLAFGFPLKAEEAYRIGLAQWLVPHDDLMARAIEVAEHIASLPPLATRLTKESLNRGIDVPLADAVLGDLYRFASLCSSSPRTSGKRTRPGARSAGLASRDAEGGCHAANRSRRRGRSHEQRQVDVAIRRAARTGTR